MHRMDRRPGILHKEIKMYVSCWDAGVFEEKEKKMDLLYSSQVWVWKHRAQSYHRSLLRERSQVRCSAQGLFPFPDWNEWYGPAMAIHACSFHLVHLPSSRTLTFEFYTCSKKQERKCKEDAPISKEQTDGVRKCKRNGHKLLEGVE